MTFRDDPTKIQLSLSIGNELGNLEFATAPKQFILRDRANNMHIKTEIAILASTILGIASRMQNCSTLRPTPSPDTAL